MALAEGRATALTLTLYRDVDCTSGCPATAGKLEARAMRNDWDEGAKNVDYDGADWCRRATSADWGLDGALQPGVDSGPVSAIAEIDSVQATVSLDLDPSEHVDPWIGADSGGALVSFRVSSADGVFVVAAREHADAVERPPRLEIRYCP